MGARTEEAEWEEPWGFAVGRGPSHCSILSRGGAALKDLWVRLQAEAHDLILKGDPHQEAHIPPCQPSPVTHPTLALVNEPNPGGCWPRASLLSD